MDVWFMGVLKDEGSSRIGGAVVDLTQARAAGLYAGEL